MQKPDKFLRFSPLKYVLNAVNELRSVFLVHPDPIFTKVEGHGCYCRNKMTDQMVQCDDCWEWYHFKCVEETKENLQAIQKYICKFCRDKVDSDGWQKWLVKKKPKDVEYKRKIKDTPKANGVSMDSDRKECKMGSNWAELVENLQKKAVANNKKDQVQKKRAEKIIKEGGHHVVDQIASAGVRLRNVTPALIDEMEGNGLLDEERVEVEEDD
jgi:PHD-finger